jgi:hypothetical protein
MGPTLNVEKLVDCIAAVGLGTGERRDRLLAGGDRSGAQAVWDLLQREGLRQRRNALQPVYANRFGVDPEGIVAASVLSDLAIAAHHAGDNGARIDALEPYAPMSSGSKRRLAGLPKQLKAAIQFNLSVCTAGCNIVDAACQSSRADLALQKLVKGDFASALCPFFAGKGAVAMPGAIQKCLTILPPREKVAWGDWANIDPQAVCPPLGLARRGQHQYQDSRNPAAAGKLAARSRDLLRPTDTDDRAQR